MTEYVQIYDDAAGINKVKCMRNVTSLGGGGGSPTTTVSNLQCTGGTSGNPKFDLTPPGGSACTIDLGALAGYSSGGSSPSGAKSTFSAAVPASPTAGDVWHTTSATSAPYAKLVSYVYDGSSWVFLSGWANAEASVGVDANFLAGVGSLAISTSALVHNTLNASSSATGITLPSAGVYDVSLQLNPGSTCTAAAGAAQFGYGLMVFANGTEVFSHFTPLNALNTAGYSGGTWGAAMQCANTAFFNANTEISFEVYASNCRVTGGCNARVSLRGRG